MQFVPVNRRLMMCSSIANIASDVSAGEYTDLLAFTVWGSLTELLFIPDHP